MFIFLQKMERLLAFLTSFQKNEKYSLKKKILHRRNVQFLQKTEKLFITFRYFQNIENFKKKIDLFIVKMSQFLQKTARLLTFPFSQNNGNFKATALPFFKVKMFNFYRQYSLKKKFFYIVIMFNFCKKRKDYYLSVFSEYRKF